jgi:hypothetical protein
LRDRRRERFPADGHRRPLGDDICFQTASGLLTVTNDDGLYTMDFPAEPAEESEIPPALVVSLGVTPTWVERNRLD